MIYYKIELPYRTCPPAKSWHCRTSVRNRKREAQINIRRIQVEHWTVGHGFMFVFTLLLVYVFWRFQKNARFSGIWITIQLFRFGWTGCTIAIMVWLAAEASSSLGMSGAITTLLGGVLGLQMANMPAFEQAKEIDKKPPEAKEDTEGKEE